MCGRATLTNGDINDVLRELQSTRDPDDATLFVPRYNIAPSNVHWIVESSGDGRVMLPAAWGYLASGRPLINVRGEQVASGRAFRQAFESCRCVMVTDGFFEWDARRMPFWYHRPRGGLVLLAGLYQRPSHPVAEDASASTGPRETTGAPTKAPLQRRFTVLTTRPNQLVAQVHDRMPVVIAPERLDDWLTGEPARASSLLTPAPEESLIATPVSRRVNSVKNDDPDCLTATTANASRPTETPRQGRLF